MKNSDLDKPKVRNNSTLILIGSILLTIIILFMVFYFLRSEKKNEFDKLYNQDYYVRVNFGETTKGNNLIDKGTFLKETDIEELEVTDPFVEGEVKEEKEGILDVKLILNGGKKINIEMQNTYQEDWAERSLFYNCRMFTEGLKKGESYYELPPCIHVGILDFNYLKSPGFYHRILLKDDTTGELYSSKFQFHVIELSKIATTKGKARKQDLYKWAKLISASTWEEIREESEGNHYMEKVRDEMIKMSQDESERYLYLREQMAIRDKASQLRSAENIGIRKGELLKLVTLVQRKIEKGDTVDKIADDLLEDQEIIEKIYNLIRKYPDKDEKEICNFLI